MASVLVIGSGVAGLTAGIYSLMDGNSVNICEKNSLIGGNLTGWTRKGCYIDNCIHWLTGTNENTELYKIWKTVGMLGDVNLYQPEILFTTNVDGDSVSLYCDLDKTMIEMIEKSEEDREEIISFFSAVKTVQYYMGVGGKEHNEKKLPGIKELKNLYKYYRMSTKDLSERFKSRLLRAFFTDIMKDAFSSVAFIIMTAVFTSGNGAIPEGGSKKSAERMKERFESFGGKIFFNKEAVRINIANGKARSVKFMDGSEISADYFIITVDPKELFGKMIDEEMPKKLNKLYEDKKFVRFSSVQCAFATREYIPFKSDYIISVPSPYDRTIGSDRLILREFSHEKSFAHEYENVLQTMVMTSEKECNEYIDLYNDREKYDKKKEEYSSAVKEVIEKEIPSLLGKLILLDVWTPATYKRFTGSDVGSYMSFTIPKSSVSPKIKNRIKSADNVIMASQWLKNPGGLPNAAYSGKDAADIIKKMERK